MDAHRPGLTQCAVIRVPLRFGCPETGEIAAYGGRRRRGRRRVVVGETVVGVPVFPVFPVGPVFGAALLGAFLLSPAVTAITMTAMMAATAPQNHHRFVSRRFAEVGVMAVVRRRLQLFAW